MNLFNFITLIPPLLIIIIDLISADISRDDGKYGNGTLSSIIGNQTRRPVPGGGHRQYPECNPAHNKFTSPIHIITNETVRDRRTPTLFVYSNTPISDYQLTLNLETGNRTNFTGVNLQLKGEGFHEATYVTGLGDVSYRFFRFALFLFGKKNQNPSASNSSLLHRIDSRSFPMEIVMYFSTGRTEDDTTQVHVMVEVGEVENPLFIPITRAATVLADRLRHMETLLKELAEQRRKVQKLERELRAKLRDHKRKGLYDEAFQLQEVIEEVHSFEKRAASAQVHLKRAEDSVQTHSALIKDKEETRKELEASLKAIGKQVSELQLKIQTLIQQEKFKEANELGPKLQDIKGSLALTERALEELQEELRTLNRVKAEEINVIKSKTEEIQYLQDHITSSFAKYNMNYESSAKAKERYKEVQSMLEGEAKDVKELEEQRAQYVKVLENSKLAIDLPRFQASWLLPPVGGHYMYNGSLPVPPCTQRAFTLVMEKFVTISQEQFEAIAAIATIPAVAGMNSTQDESGQLIFPPYSLNPGRRGAVVTYNKKNLQYVLDDAVHMPSKKRRKLKEAIRSWRNSSTSPWLSLSPSVWIISAAVFHIIPTVLW